ncbi:MAG TPA: nodulation protein NfeD [Xanthomonadales bacterium]|nr:nodulation protein NfeD [Xanthomonadales bacterium]
MSDAAMPPMRIQIAALTFLLQAGLALGADGPVVVLTLKDAIGPATADYIHRNLELAAAQQAQLVVLQMDTPGGLDTSMRSIIKDILAAPIPVATFVAPSGARAASAGTYILYASHVAAMAPATNLGAATPISIGGLPGAPEPQSQPQEPDGKPGKNSDQTKDTDKTKDTERDWMSDASRRKAVFDAAAYIRGLAQLRGRNADWAEKAVREAVSLPAEEALQLKVIDLIATDLPDLLGKLDGQQFTIAGQIQILRTRDVKITVIEPDWRSRFLALITDPSIAYILLLLGMYGLLMEFYNPGFVLPGVVGTICLLIALYALQLLPVNYAGVALIFLGMAFMIAEVFVPAYGSLGIGGVIAFVIGSVMMIDTEVPGFALPWSLIAAIAFVSVLFVLVVVGMAVRARKRPVVSGSEEMVGAAGEVIEDFVQEGWALIHSENWKVRSAVPLKRGQKIRVTTINGLVLDVAPDDTITREE